MVTRWSASRQARETWKHRYAATYDARPCGADVKEGFIVAYVETALGGKGCPPPIPESPLVSIHSLTHSYPSGDHWFIGYHLGHTAALSSGIDRDRFAPLDPSLVCSQKQLNTVPIGYRHGIESWPHDHSGPGLLHEITPVPVPGFDPSGNRGERGLLEDSSEMLDFEPLPAPIVAPSGEDEIDGTGADAADRLESDAPPLQQPALSPADVY